MTTRRLLWEITCRGAAGGLFAGFILGGVYGLSVFLIMLAIDVESTTSSYYNLETVIALALAGVFFGIIFGTPTGIFAGMIDGLAIGIVT